MYFRCQRVFVVKQRYIRFVIVLTNLSECLLRARSTYTISKKNDRQEQKRLLDQITSDLHFQSKEDYYKLSINVTPIHLFSHQTGF
jgi:hypothetical protein